MSWNRSSRHPVCIPDVQPNPESRSGKASIGVRTILDRLTPAQVRGARAMLDWSMVELAYAARVSVSMIKRIEDAERSVSDDLCNVVRDALETAGVRFLPDDGNGSGMRFRRR